jgi:GH24 family phage-related lysozyme (muramidase)
MFVMVIYWVLLLSLTISAYANPKSISYREDAMKHIIANEGYIKYVYMDTKGNKTAGIGHKLTDNTYFLGDTVSDETIIDWFINDFDVAIKCATKFHLSTNNNVNIVLTDMAFNLGCSGLNQFKLLKKHLMNNNLYMASKAIKYSYYYKQVTNRAKRNISLINK